jgi:hypothetical protein
MIKIEIIAKEYGVEMALIILACRVYFKTANKQELEDFIQTSGSAIQWDHFFKSCRLQKVRSVVYKSVVSCNIPHKTRQHIRSELIFLAKRHLHLALETERIIKLLEKNNITAFPYKGAAFSKQFFGDLASRDITDIDLIIQKSDIYKVIEIMKNDGYVSELEDIFHYLGDDYFFYYKDYNFNTFSNGKRVIHLEFHWDVAERILGMPQNTADLIYKPYDKSPIINHELTFIDPTAHFTALLVHHTRKDVLKQLKTLIDIGAAMQDQFNLLNHDELKCYISNLNLQQSFAVSQALLYKLFNITPTFSSSTTISKKTIKNFTHQLLGNKLPDIYYLSRLYIVNHILLRDDFSKKVKFLFNFTWFFSYPTTADFQFIRLPKPLFFIYFFLKPVRMVSQRWRYYSKAA